MPYRFELSDECRATYRKIDCTPINFVPSSKTRVGVAALGCSVHGNNFKGTAPMRDAIRRATGGFAFEYDSTGGFIARRLCSGE